MRDLGLVLLPSLRARLPRPGFAMQPCCCCSREREASRAKRRGQGARRGGARRGHVVTGGAAASPRRRHLLSRRVREAARQQGGEMRTRLHAAARRVLPSRRDGEADDRSRLCPVRVLSPHENVATPACACFCSARSIDYCEGARYCIAIPA